MAEILTVCVCVTIMAVAVVVAAVMSSRAKDRQVDVIVESYRKTVSEMTDAALCWNSAQLERMNHETARYLGPRPAVRDDGAPPPDAGPPVEVVGDYGEEALEGVH